MLASGMINKQSTTTILNPAPPSLALQSDATDLNDQQHSDHMKHNHQEIDASKTNSSLKQHHPGRLERIRFPHEIESQVDLNDD